MQYLRSNTAVIVTVGPFFDKADGVTLETALTITNERITLTADTDDGSAPTNILDNVTGATSGTSNDLNYITGNDAGMMQLELSAANVNRVGRMFLSITDAANHVPVYHEYFVLPQAIYDWLTGVIVPLPANVTTIAGSAVSTSTAQLGVNVVNFGGSAGTFASGIPAVNATQVSGDSTAADNLELAYDDTAGAVSWNGIVDQGTAQSVGANDIVLRSAAAFVDDALIGCTVVITNGTQVGSRSIITDYVGATDTATLGNGWTGATPTGTPTYKIFGSAAGGGVAQTGDAYADTQTLLTRLGTPSDLGGGATVAFNLSDIEAQTDDIGTAGAGLTSIPNSAGVTTLLSRVPSGIFTGMTSLAQWLGLIAGKQTGDSTARTEVRATGAGSGTFDETTDSVQALRDRGDAAWITATGFSTLSGADVLTQVNAALDAVIADSIPADGTRPSLRQAAYLNTQFLFERSVSGTTVTVKKVDGSTLFTLLLNDATTPTSITRAT